MPTKPVQAAAEGLPNFTRRSILEHGAVAVAGGAAIAFAVPDMDARATAAMPHATELARLIEKHREAYAAMEAYSPTLADAQRAWFGDRTSADLTETMNSVEAMEKRLFDAERAAFVALLAYPRRDLTELRAVLTIAMESWWNDCGPEEDEFAALVAGIMGG